MYNIGNTNNIRNMGHDEREIYQMISEMQLKNVLVNTLTRAHTFLICQIHKKIQSYIDGCVDWG